MTPFQSYNKKLAIYSVTKTVTRNSNVFRVGGSYTSYTKMLAYTDIFLFSRDEIYRQKCFFSLNPPVRLVSVLLVTTTA